MVKKLSGIWWWKKERKPAKKRRFCNGNKQQCKLPGEPFWRRIERVERARRRKKEERSELKT
jgi:hypothetical protein